MLAFSKDIGHEVWARHVSSSQCSAAGFCERGYFIFLFSNCGAGGRCLLRIYVAVSGEAVNVYYLPS